MMKELIRSGLEQLGLTPSIPAQAPEQLAQYGQALIEKNQVMNLTAITEPRDVATLHMLDCAPLLACGQFSGRTLIDVETGAGFPGLALKILVPSLEVTLLDSLQKRLAGWMRQRIAWGWRACTPSTPGRKRPAAPPHSGKPLTLPPHGRWPICDCCVSCACPLSRLGGASWP